MSKMAKVWAGVYVVVLDVTVVVLGVSAIMAGLLFMSMTSSTGWTGSDEMAWLTKADVWMAMGSLIFLAMWCQIDPRWASSDATLKES